MEQMSLAGLLIWLTSAGGAVALTLWAMDNVPWLKARTSEERRYLSLGIAGLVPVVAWLGSVGLGYSSAPATWQGWLESIFAVAAPAILASQGLHGRLKLRGKSPN